MSSAWHAKAHTQLCNVSVLAVSVFVQIVAEQVQEEQERSRAHAAKHDSVLQQLSAEQAHTAELDAQIESQHKVCLCNTYSGLYVQLSQASAVHTRQSHKSSLCTTCNTTGVLLVSCCMLVVCAATLQVSGLTLLIIALTLLIKIPNCSPQVNHFHYGCYCDN